jgi:hypothetical protein
MWTNARDVESMIRGMKARPLLEWYRGLEPINLSEVTRLVMAFSNLLMDLEEFIESIDLNPVIGSSTKCVVADARIMLRES